MARVGMRKSAYMFVCVCVCLSLREIVRRSQLGKQCNNGTAKESQKIDGTH